MSASTSRGDRLGVRSRLVGVAAFQSADKSAHSISYRGVVRQSSRITLANIQRLALRRILTASNFRLFYVDD